MEFKVDIGRAEWDPKTTVIKLHGSLDAQTAPIFEKEAMSAIARGERRILVDCGGINFVSSAGVGVFMVILSEVESEGFLKVMNLSDEVFESFDILGIPEVMEIYKDEKEVRKSEA